MVKKILAVFVCNVLIATNINASIMRHDINVQDYRDFGENLGKYTPGSINVPVYRKSGVLDDVLPFSLPDFGMVISRGFATLVSPSYLATARHNRNISYREITFGNGAKFAAKYLVVNRNDSEISNVDFALPRLSKVVTDAAPIGIVNKTTIRQEDRKRFSWYTRVGAGLQMQINDEQTEEVQLSGSYKWKSGGTMANGAVTFASGTLRWINYGPDSPLSTPFSNATRAGDSGSPVLVYDEVEQQWKIVGVHHAALSNNGIYKRLSGEEYIPDNYLENILALNSLPDITDTAAGGDIHWMPDTITQDGAQWAWQGLPEKYKNQTTNKATYAELDATKDIRFSGGGNRILLADAVNMGMGKLQFSADYTLESAPGANATWIGGGVEVDAGKNVLWKVNGVANDALHKIGAGTLHFQAMGVNPGELNVGDGLVILDQQADENGKKQAFSKVTLVSGRPVVRLDSADQIDPQAIQFGYRGGVLDINGHDISFSEIKHNDNGAKIVNRNKQAATISLTGQEQVFLGTLGEENNKNALAIRYSPSTTGEGWTLRGGAWADRLDVTQGTLALAGEQVKHAGNVYFSDDWLEKDYSISSVNVADNAALTVKEHTALTGDILMGKNAVLSLWDRATLAGNLVLKEADSFLRADITDRTSTMGATASLLSADVSGAGKIVKTGSGMLTVSGKVANLQGIEVNEGQLQVTGNIAAPVNMGKSTLLSGDGYISNLNLNDTATIAPGAINFEFGRWSALRVGTLNTSEPASLQINSAFTGNTTDRLLIDGDLNTPEGKPLELVVNAVQSWQDSDSNKNGAADNREGTSLVQVGGKSRADSVRLASGYVARGAWAYGLYAFAPGHASTDERQVKGEGNQYWDYRLQNIMLDAEGISTPVDPTPAPAPQPEPLLRRSRTSARPHSCAGACTSARPHSCAGACTSARTRPCAETSTSACAETIP